MTPMPARDVGLAAGVAVCWGLNFIAIDASLDHYPPMFLVALRFALLAVPALLLVPRPDVPLRWLLGYGAGFGVAQFVFLYAGLEAGMPVGLASLVLQASAPFTVLLAAVLLGERTSRRQLVGVAVAVAGLAVIAAWRGLTVSLLPVVLVLLGALGWAFGNLASRRAQPDSPFALMMWMTVVPPVPMLALSLLVEGPSAIGGSLATALDADALGAALGLLYTVVVGTVVGSGVWTALLRRHPSSTVAPFSMLVPVTGLTAAWLVLGEVPALVEVLGGVLVVAGVLWGSGVGRRAGRRPGLRPGRLGSGGGGAGEPVTEVSTR
ncbi:EamA family transporter [Nocardioides lentus]|uniref:EamA family transporter n=1 Tax=Nocardioides lentus TaxID=338077 RepID=A0ABP5B0A3_9ACTN